MQHGADGKGVMPPERFSDRLRIRSDQSALHDSKSYGLRSKSRHRPDLRRSGTPHSALRLPVSDSPYD
jgi:hypothetical protein